MSSWTAGRLEDARVAACLPKLLSEFLSLFFLFNLVGFSVANVLVNVAAAREKNTSKVKIDCGKQIRAARDGAFCQLFS